MLSGRSIHAFCSCSPLWCLRGRLRPWRSASLLVCDTAGKAAQLWGPFYGPKIGQESVNPNCWGSRFAALFFGPESGPKIGPPSCCEIHRSRCSRAALPLMRADAPLICKVCACAGGFVSLVLCVVSIAPHAACVDLVGCVLHATRGVSRSRRVCSVVCAHAS